MALLRSLTSRSYSTQKFASVQANNNNNNVFDEKKYQHLDHASPVDTDYFQKSLPRLPIPPLDKTCARYLASQRPLLGPSEFARTQKLVEQFLKSEGSLLDSQLRKDDKMNKETSYINGPWTDMYLRDRRPVVFTHNPGICLSEETRPELIKEPLLRVANSLISSVRFFKSLQNGTLHPDVFHMRPSQSASYWAKVKWMPGFAATPISYLFKVFPLDMSQFPHLLQSTRIPKVGGKDELKRFPQSRHVVVAKNGTFYTFDVLDKNGNLYEPQHFVDCLKQIYSSTTKISDHVGVLTSADRDLWAKARQKLESLGNNFEKIDSALFAISLEDWKYEEDKVELAVKQLCCGEDVPANRWFDKSFNLIFSKNGLMGINFEHSWGDGVAVMRYINEMVQDCAKHTFVDAGMLNKTCTSSATVETIEFMLDDEVKEAIKVAKADHKARYDSVAFHGFLRHGLGKNECKKANVGPDALMQAGFQMAYRRLHGKFVSTYESCSTAIYRHGRTETVRPLTDHTRGLAEAFCSTSKDKKSDKELLAMLQNCSKLHFELTKSAAQGQGWDRHLFALKHLAAQQGLATPDIFNDEAYLQINQNGISTSTLSTDNIANGGFCPVIPDGYGLGYKIRDDALGVATASYVKHTSCSDMTSALIDSFDDLERVVKAGL